MQGRIQKILSAHAVSSRRAAEELIREGRVTVNGYTAGIGDTADDELDAICVDGRTLPKAEEPVYIMLNKPRGYITSKSDNRGRLTVMQLMSGAGAAVYPVGRLDMDTEGLLLMTNDGEFANMVMHPSSGITKTYEALVSGDITQGVRMLRNPVEIDSHVVRAVSVALIERADRTCKDSRTGKDSRTDRANSTNSSAVLVIEIAEGRNRQVRKMCAACELRIKSLRRTAIGKLQLAALEPGRWRRLSADEVSLLKENIMSDG